MIAPAEAELRGGPHCRRVRADVDRVGDEQQGDQGQNQAFGHDFAEIGRRALAGDPADAGADQLDRGHQRIGQRHGPKQPESELRAGLGIGGDPARIVVRSAGDQTRSELIGQGDGPKPTP